jgi:hypothetical protein
MVAALTARTRSRSAWPSCNRPCCSRAGSKVGIITLSRLPHTRSDASHSAVSASLTGGLERWLYRLVRKHGGRQQGGWSFDFLHLHAKSGSLSPLKHFAFDLREIVQRQTLPGYELVITRDRNGVERLNFASHCIDQLADRLRKRGLAPEAGDKL